MSANGDDQSTAQTQTDDNAQNSQGTTWAGREAYDDATTAAVSGGRVTRETAVDDAQQSQAPTRDVVGARTTPDTMNATLRQQSQHTNETHNEFEVGTIVVKKDRRRATITKIANGRTYFKYENNGMESNMTDKGFANLFTAVEPKIHRLVGKGASEIEIRECLRRAQEAGKPDYVNERNLNCPSGFTPIFMVQSPQTLAILLRNGANIHAVDNKGNTCLFKFVRSTDKQGRSNRPNGLPLVQMAVNSGAQPTPRNKAGFTPADVSRKMFGENECLRYLLEVEARLTAVRERTLSEWERGANPGQPPAPRAQSIQSAQSLRVSTSATTLPGARSMTGLSGARSVTEITEELKEPEHERGEGEAERVKMHQTLQSANRMLRPAELPNQSDSCHMRATGATDDLTHPPRLTQPFRWTADLNTHPVRLTQPFRPPPVAIPDTLPALNDQLTAQTAPAPRTSRQVTAAVREGRPPGQPRHCLRASALAATGAADDPNSSMVFPAPRSPVVDPNPPAVPALRPRADISISMPSPVSTISSSPRAPGDAQTSDGEFGSQLQDFVRKDTEFMESIVDGERDLGAEVEDMVEDAINPHGLREAARPMDVRVPVNGRPRQRTTSSSRARKGSKRGSDAVSPRSQKRRRTTSSSNTGSGEGRGLSGQAQTPQGLRSRAPAVTSPGGHHPTDGPESPYGTESPKLQRSLAMDHIERPRFEFDALDQPGSPSSPGADQARPNFDDTDQKDADTIDLQATPVEPEAQKKWRHNHQGRS